MAPRRTAASSETPQRTTRARSKTPLPAIASAASHAYGAPGKTNLAEQMRGGESGDFAAEFEESRTTDAVVAAPAIGGARSAVTTTDEVRSVRAPSLAPEPRRRQHTARPAVIHEEGSEMEDRRPPPPAQPDNTPLGRDNTDVDHRARYAGFFAPLRAVIRGQLENPNSHFYIITLCCMMLSFGFISGILSLFVPVPASVDARRENFTWGMRIAFQHSPFERPMPWLEQTWHQYKHDVGMIKEFPGVNIPEIQWAINGHVMDRLKALDKRVGNLEKAIALTNETISEMRQMFPERVWVQIVNGQPEIPADFWTALEHRIAENTDMAPRWQAWLLENEEQIAGYIDQSNGAIIDRLLESGQIVQREEFLKTIDERNSYLASQYEDEVLAMWTQEAAKIQQVATTAAKSELSETFSFQALKGQIQHLLRLKQYENAYHALHVGNWFSVGRGARIDPHLTSATKDPAAKSWSLRVYRALSPTRFYPNSPITALMRWEEPGECWCGTPDEHGVVQLGILTGSVYPESLMIEHIPPKAAPNIKAAPRGIEVWAEFNNKSGVELAYKDLARSGVPNIGECDSVSPGSGWECIHRGEYDTTRGDHVQVFRLWPTWVELATTRIIVRATSNWGADYTCFYRVRMAGEAAPEPKPARGWLWPW